MPLSPLPATRYYAPSGAPLVYGDSATRANIESFWRSVADLASERGLHLGAGLLECDETGQVLTDEEGASDVAPQP